MRSDAVCLLRCGKRVKLKKAKKAIEKCVLCWIFPSVHKAEVEISETLSYVTFDRQWSHEKFALTPFHEASQSRYRKVEKCVATINVIVLSCCWISKNGSLYLLSKTSSHNVLCSISSSPCVPLSTKRIKNEKEFAWHLFNSALDFCQIGN